MIEEANNLILHNARLVPALLPVIRQSTAWWKTGAKGTAKRHQEIRCVILHHTAGESSGPMIYKRLSERGLSVHFTIDYHGIVMQHVDSQTVAFHAKDCNRWSVGIEMQSCGVPPASPKYPRPVYQDFMHGKPKQFVGFTDAQVDAAHLLCSSLCEILHIPYAFPLADNGRMVSRDVLDSATLGAFRGVIGHYHTRLAKIDPAPHLLDTLHMRGSACKTS